MEDVAGSPRQDVYGNVCAGILAEDDSVRPETLLHRRLVLAGLHYCHCEYTPLQTCFVAYSSTFSPTFLPLDFGRDVSLFATDMEKESA